MTNGLALILAAVLLLFFGGDYYFGWGASVFLGQEILALMDYVAIWR